MSRYAAMFERCRDAGEGAFGAFLMLGDPDLERCPAYLDALVAGGADMIELGIPFSDPVADGPVIEAAAGRALAAGVRPADCLALIATLRRRYADVPIGILTYANIVGARGIDCFMAELAEAGADSLLIADVPTLEAAPFAGAARQAGIDLVMIAAPTTPEPAVATIAALSKGYTYCVARLGVTGTEQAPEFVHGTLFATLARFGAPPPVLGFGIATPADVRAALASGAAGVIAGSALVRQVGQGQTPDTLRAAVAALKAATRSD